ARFEHHGPSPPRFVDLAARNPSAPSNNDLHSNEAAPERNSVFTFFSTKIARNRSPILGAGASCRNSKRHQPFGVPLSEAQRYLNAANRPRPCRIQRVSSSIICGPIPRISFDEQLSDAWFALDPLARRKVVTRAATGLSGPYPRPSILRCPTGLS